MVAAKPYFNKFIVLKEIYMGLMDFKQASEACAAALQIRPDDQDLMSEMRSLAAQHAMHAGKYGRAKSFRESIRDMSGQQKLMENERDVQSDDIRLRRVRDAKTEFDLARMTLPSLANISTRLRGDGFAGTRKCGHRKARRDVQDVSSV